MSGRKKITTEAEPDPVTAFLHRWIEILGGTNLDALEPWAKCFIIESRQLLATRTKEHP